MVSMLNQQILIDLKNYDADFAFLNKSMGVLRKKFANKYIIIRNKKVISSSNNMKEAIDSAKQKGVPVEKCVIEFISKKDEVFIL
jgi:hypothetical protein